MKTEKERKRIRRLTGLLVGILAVYGFKIFLGYGIFLSFFFGLLAMIIVSILFRLMMGSPVQESSILEGVDVTASEIRKTIEGSREKVRNIRNSTMRIRDNKTAGQIQEICRVASQIIDNLQKDPRDIKKARQFILYYLDATEKIVIRYGELSDKRETTPDVEKSLSKVEGILQMIKEAFDKQLAHLLENQLMDLDTEVDVLRKTIEMEGLH